jgi:hypothetical protein
MLKFKNICPSFVPALSQLCPSHVPARSQPGPSQVPAPLSPLRTQKHTKASKANDLMVLTPSIWTRRGQSHTYGNQARARKQVDQPITPSKSSQVLERWVWLPAGATPAEHLTRTPTRTPLSSAQCPAARKPSGLTQRAWYQSRGSGQDLGILSILHQACHCSWSSFETAKSRVMTVRRS